jgi:predicted Zn-dependent peptidase
VGPDPIKQTAVLAELRDEICQLSRNGITESELARAKEKALGGMEIRNQSIGAFASGCTVDELCGLGAEHYLVERERIRSVTLEEVSRVALQYLGQVPTVTSIAGPVAVGAQGPFLSGGDNDRAGEDASGFSSEDVNAGG